MVNWKVLSPWNYCGDSWFRHPDSARAVRAKVAPSETAAPEVTKHVLKGHNHRLVHMATRAGPSRQALHTHHQNCYMATAKNIRLGSHTQTHTRSIPRSMGYGSKGGCVIQALGSPPPLLQPPLLPPLLLPLHLPPAATTATALLLLLLLLTTISSITTTTDLAEATRLNFKLTSHSSQN